MKRSAIVLAGAAVLAMAATGCQQARNIPSSAATEAHQAVRRLHDIESSAATRVRHVAERLTHRLGMGHGHGRRVSSGLRERGNGFIGEVRFAVERPGESPTAVKYTIEEGKVRYDLLDGKGHPTASVVADLPARKAFAVLQTGDIVDLAPVTGPGDPARSLDDAVVLRRPDKVDRVAGRLCEVWQMSTVTRDVDVCATSGMSWFDLLPRWNADHLSPSWSAELSRDRYFPLRVIVKDKRGHEVLRMQASEVRQGSVDDSLFESAPQARVVAALPGRALPSAT